MSEHAEPHTEKCDDCSYVMRSLVDALTHTPEACAEWQRHDELLRLRAENERLHTELTDSRTSAQAAWDRASVLSEKLEEKS